MSNGKWEERARDGSEGSKAYACGIFEYALVLWLLHTLMISYVMIIILGLVELLYV